MARISSRKSFSPSFPGALHEAGFPTTCLTIDSGEGSKATQSREGLALRGKALPLVEVERERVRPREHGLQVSELATFVECLQEVALDGDGTAAPGEAEQDPASIRPLGWSISPHGA